MKHYDFDLYYSLRPMPFGEYNVQVQVKGDYIPHYQISSATVRVCIFTINHNVILIGIIRKIISKKGCERFYSKD